MSFTDDAKDDDRPSNTLELFSEVDEVVQMIDDLKTSINFEKDYEKFTEILSRYQEQPHLIDPHLEMLLLKLLTHIRTSYRTNVELMHNSFKYLYILSKVRTFKALVKFLPHELCDLELALELLELQDLSDSNNWETRYVLLLWMSILVLNPFHMSRLDAFKASDDIVENDHQMNHIRNKTKMERIYNLCILYTESNDTCSSVAAFLSAKYLVRVDIKELYLEKFLNYVMTAHNADTINVKFGQLAAVSAILKTAKREDIIVYADTILKWILSCNYKKDSDFLKYKYYIKIIQRIGLIYLKPRIAAWRYKRGVRSLITNLTLSTNKDEILSGNENFADDENDDDFEVPENIEDVIEELLQGLRSANSEIRWSSAKGLGRVTNRLSKNLGDEVVGTVIEIFNPLESNEAWHGACLAIAELAKRGLLLPYRLKTMVPHLLEALFYDEMKGYMSVGQHIRDASCYMCWAFARAYDSNELKPFVNQISAGLLTTAVFDREINCRRAASAAFQESVGRLGNFPHGIEISTMTDFYSVGMRTNSFLEISVYIAQFEEYKQPLIDHLIEKKIGHWDTVVRDLASKTLHKLSAKAPDYMANEILPKLFKNTNTIDINLKHGSILAIGEIVLALKEIENNCEVNQNLFSNQILTEIYDLMSVFLKRDLFRGMSGEMMKECCISFIVNCCKARLEASAECVESWQLIIDKCITNKNTQIRESATIALSELCKAYYDIPNGSYDNNLAILNSYLSGTDNDLEEHMRMGFINAIGSLPKFMILPKLEFVINNLIKHSLLPQSALQELLKRGDSKFQNENPITYSWSEARRESIRALANVVQTIGFTENTEESISNPKYLNMIFDCYLKALEEYTLDNRGDIGAWVREAAMIALHQLITSCPQHLLKPEIIHKVMSGFAQQAVEKIDRTRGLAGKLFCQLIYASPMIPYIKNHEELKKIFPEDNKNILWLFADHTFPYFCTMLELTEYSSKIILGLSASIGQLTESLIKYSSSSLFQFLRSHSTEINRICSEIVQVFEENSMNERVTYPMLNFLDILLSSGTVDIILMNENSNFADELFRLVCIEIKGHKKLYKLVSSINVFCQLLQVPRLFIKILSKMAIFLGLTHVHIRKTTATKVYEALALHGTDCGISDEKLDEILSLLSETDWGLPLNEVRPLRNQFCELLGIKPPVSAIASKN